MLNRSNMPVLYSYSNPVIIVEKRTDMSMVLGFLVIRTR